MLVHAFSMELVRELRARRRAQARRELLRKFDGQTRAARQHTAESGCPHCAALLAATQDLGRCPCAAHAA
jgi:hypothetical protein